MENHFGKRTVSSHILFELCKFWYLAQGQILGTTLYFIFYFIFNSISLSGKCIFVNYNWFQTLKSTNDDIQICRYELSCLMNSIWNVLVTSKSASIFQVLKFSFSEKAHKDLKKNVKLRGRFLQILWPSHNAQWCVFNNSSLIGIKICQILTHKTKL